MNYCSKVKDSLNYIEKNLDNKITLDALANKAHLSKYHYHRLFCKMVGVSVNKYINQRRMEKAAEELIFTDWIVNSKSDNFFKGLLAKLNRR